jgi:hypothetical protein
MFTGDVQRESLDTVRIFADVYRRIAVQLDQGDNLQSHPWYGVGNRDLQLFDKERVCATLSRWQDALDGLVEIMAPAGSLFGAENASVLHDLDGIETLKNELGEIPALHGDEVLSALPHLRDENLAVLTRHLQLFREIQEHRQALSERLRPQFLSESESYRQLRSAYAELEQLGVEGQTDLGTLTKHLKRIERLKDGLKELGKPMAQVAIHLGHRSPTL